MDVYFKKVTIVSALAAAFIPAVAQADTLAEVLHNWEERSYAQAKPGFADVGTSDNALTLTATAGLKTPSIHPNLAVEADMLTTIADGESSYPSSMGSTTVEASAFGLGGYAVANYYDLPVQGLVPFVRAGIAYTSLSVEAGNSAVSYSGEGSSFGIGLGAGLRYSVDNKLSAVVDFTSTDVDVFSAGVQYNF